jgi:hypothetical protein
VPAAADTGLPSTVIDTTSSPRSDGVVWMLMGTLSGFVKLASLSGASRQL